MVFDVFLVADLELLLLVGVVTRLLLLLLVVTFGLLAELRVLVLRFTVTGAFLVVAALFTADLVLVVVERCGASLELLLFV